MTSHSSAPHDSAPQDSAPHGGNPNTTAAARPGRRPATSRERIGTVALELFVERGFDDTSVDDIAHACGIARRTLFRYFPSKNAIPWGDFDAHLANMRERLAALPDDLPMSTALAAALLDFNTFPAEETANHRRRMELILRVPALQAHSALMYAGWRDVVAQYAARRLDVPADSPAPRTIGHLLLGVAMSAYESWLDDHSLDLGRLLADGMATLEHGLDAAPRAATGHEDDAFPHVR
ncbi:mycofactocin system transcriptional regulator [Rhodococcus sp. HNM0569]|uniref:mycofactocin system transcriptional regulator n=1 Tax=Rhodococcus sp. HNM0569 TaxID=2716340 RepID=UPI001469F565|nr:mycofactocin system transcriptional regulator [Rhodococcus sp. HNM0569]NLU81677.1 mycofactocin system transcriptional regulator [Rhodococcus sp. HNM0569]